MKNKVIWVLAIPVVLFSCNGEQKNNNHSGTDSITSHSAIVNTEDNATSTVDISKYTLISDSREDRRNEAREILQVKRKWPLAMQSLNPLAFDSILSKNFTFKGSDGFYTRSAYIENRTKPDEWKITFVKYDNVTLQFFGETGVLSYMNHITNKNTNTGAIEYEHISWVDIYIREGGKWKIGSAHAIDYRLEPAGP